ncbi:hypothetical protein H2203_003007 [Taxawa tesnikishii (nom. ined.)]|nr:hypothetical protein H2203_003007 [Dothideales sp. JES 119]
MVHLVVKPKPNFDSTNGELHPTKSVVPTPPEGPHNSGDDDVTIREGLPGYTEDPKDAIKGRNDASAKVPRKKGGKGAKQQKSTTWAPLRLPQGWNPTKMFVGAKDEGQVKSKEEMLLSPATPKAKAPERQTKSYPSVQIPRRTPNVAQPQELPLTGDKQVGTETVGDQTTPKAFPNDDAPSNVPPKKMLQLTGSGTFLPPVTKPHADHVAEETKTKNRRGRPKKKQGQLLVILRYPIHMEGLGPRISRILSGEERHTPPLQPSKATHPFFLGKAKNAPGVATSSDIAHDIAQSPARKASAITPGKLRMQTRNIRGRENEDRLPQPSFGMARDRQMIKHPGLREAAWPDREAMHVHGSMDVDKAADVEMLDEPSTRINAGYPLRKMKDTSTRLNPQESILNVFRSTLDFEPKQPVDDGFPEPPDCLRKPNKLLITGPTIQVRALESLQPGAQSTHQACKSMFEAIPSTLTPFDEGRCETRAWSQKYAPTSAAQVLQTGKEATILREWMKALTVVAVGTASAPSKSDKPDPKHKKKRLGLDDFIIDSDEEGQLRDELTEPEDAGDLPQGSQKRTVVRGGIDATAGLAQGKKLTNAVLISGSSGCGKSAMVYAVAKELSFEIFEINSSSRRTGKDILERIGDMTENHLVQRHLADAGDISTDEEVGRLTEAFSKDLESDEQLAGEKKKAAKPKPVQAEAAQPKLKPARNQKQSLILLEEVDVLFEEDRGFWTTVFELLKSSRRPVIMTCNNEDLVPLNVLSLHAILRLSQPPVDLAASYLLLMAAREGHILEHAAVETLYRTKGHDLRASIADLQFFCQMGVGDPRGGLGWIFQRWPAGTGMDVDGKPIRVASEATYTTGMGCLTYEPSLLDESTVLNQAWEEWLIDPRDGAFQRAETQTVPVKANENPQARIRALKHFGTMIDGLSAADIFCNVGLPAESRVILDPSQPPISDKKRASYIDGRPLLQTDEQIDYTNMDTQLAIAISELATDRYNPSRTPRKPHLSSSNMLAEITSQRDPHRPNPNLTRLDFSAALDPIGEPPRPPSPHSPACSILHLMYDIALEEQRLRLGTLLDSRGGAKRARTTRAARSALEGGKRESTRRERWFPREMDLDLVLKTGGKEWPKTTIGPSAGSVGDVSVGASREGSADEMAE